MTARALLASCLVALWMACGGGGGAGNPDGGAPRSSLDGGKTDAGAVHLPDGGDSVPDAGTPPGPPPPWTVTAHFLQGDGGTELRQGVGPFRLELDGTGLSTVTGYSISNDFNELPVTVQSASDTQVVLSGTARHGLPLGDYVLTLAGGGFTSGVPQVVTVVPISAATSPGASDTSGWGTPLHPFRTLFHSKQIAEAGDEISLGEGTYDDAHGETWDNAEVNPSNPTLPGNVPPGVTIVGAGDSTVLASTATNGDLHTGLVFLGDAGVANLKVSNFHRGIFVRRGTVKLENVSCAGGQNDCFFVAPDAGLNADSCVTQGSKASGVAVFSGSVVLTGLTSRGNRTGVYANGGQLRISHSTVSGNGIYGTVLESGLVGLNGALLTVGAVDFTSNYGAALYLWGGAQMNMTGGSVSATLSPSGGLSAGAVQLVGGVDVQLQGVSVHDNARAGISGDQLGTSTLRLVNDTFARNGMDVFVDGGTAYSIFVRGTVASGSGEFIHAYGGYAIDLGTANDGGYNTLSATGHVLSLDGFSGSNITNSSHTSFNGSVPAAATVNGPVNTAQWDLLTSSDHLHLY